MVSNVSFSGSYNKSGLTSNDLENVAKYAMGTTLVPAAGGPFDGGGLMLAIGLAPEVFKLRSWFSQFKNPAEALKGDFAKIKDNFTAQKELVTQKGLNNPETYQTLYKNGSIAEKEFAAEAAKAKLDVAAQKLSEGKTSFFSKVKAFFSKKSVSVIEGEKISKFTKEATEAAEAAKLAKVAGTAAEETAKVASLGSKALKCVKGNAPFIAIGGAMELFTQIIPAFTQLGADKGIAQVGKSTVKVAASAAGWTAGAAVGAAVGSVLPVAGTAVGAVVGGVLGFVGGCIGSWLADKAAKSVVGKDELEIAQEEKAKQDAQEASQNPQAAQKLLVAAQQRFISEGNTEDAKAVSPSIANLSNELQQMQTQNAQFTSYNPAMTGNQQSDSQQSNGQQPNNTYSYNPVAFGSTNPFGQSDWMNKDFMAMCAGLV